MSNSHISLFPYTQVFLVRVGSIRISMLWAARLLTSPSRFSGVPCSLRFAPPTAPFQSLPQRSRDGVFRSSAKTITSTWHASARRRSVRTPRAGGYRVSNPNGLPSSRDLVLPAPFFQPLPNSQQRSPRALCITVILKIISANFWKSPQAKYIAGYANLHIVTNFFLENQA